MEKKELTLQDERKKTYLRLVKDNNSVIILVLLLLVAFIAIDGYGSGFYNVIRYASMYGPVCLGIGLVMITGNIDLSAGFQAGLAGVSSVIAFNAAYGATGNAGLSLVLSLVGAVLTGVVTGLINGFFVAKVGISSLIATIAANYAYQGAVFFFAYNSFSADDANTIKLIAQTKLLGIRWLNPMTIIFVALVIIVALWMYTTRFGNRLHIVGDNPEAAAFAGISVPNTVWVTYIVSGMLAAVSGFMMVSNAGYAIYSQGNSLQTLTISCCVIGGIKMTGGKGTAIHVLLGVLIMRTISQMMTAMFLSADMVNLITGILLIVVLVIDRFTSAKSVDE